MPFLLDLSESYDPPYLLAWHSVQIVAAAISRYLATVVLNREQLLFEGIQKVTIGEVN